MEDENYYASDGGNILGPLVKKGIDSKSESIAKNKVYLNVGFVHMYFLLPHVTTKSLFSARNVALLQAAKLSNVKKCLPICSMG